MPHARAGLSHARARDYDRDIKVWTLVNIVQGETEKEARDFYDDYVHQQGDWEAAKNMVDTFSLEINKRDVPPERIKPLQEAFIRVGAACPWSARASRSSIRLRRCRRPASTACWSPSRVTRKACGNSAM